MNDQAVSRQVQQMVKFIRQEAECVGVGAARARAGER
jgi:hypothetical protein